MRAKNGRRRYFSNQETSKHSIITTLITILTFNKIFNFKTIDRQINLTQTTLTTNDTDNERELRKDLTKACDLTKRRTKLSKRR